jgi:anti-sigma factor RsiW
MSHVDEGTLHELVDNELSAAQRATVEAHLASCGECAKRFAEATSMARQVVSLLGALDEDRGSVQMVARAVSAESVRSVETRTSSARTVTRHGVWTLRRVALAASVALVAGVSYEVGKRGDASAPSASMATAVKLPAAPTSMRAVPSVVDGVADSFTASPTPAPRVRPRGGPRAEAADVSAEQSVAAEPSTMRAPLVAAPGAAAPPAVAAVTATSSEAAKPALAQSGIAAKAASNAVEQERAASPRREQYAEQSANGRAAEPGGNRRARNADSDGAAAQAQSAPAPTQQPAQNVQRDAQSGAVMAEAELRGSVSAAKKAVPLPGYTATQESSAGAVTRLRYMSSAGTPLTLMIVQSASEAKQRASRADAAPAPAPAPVSEFLVSTANGVSAVRWSARGVNYELSGALAPDSRVKLATQCKERRRQRS